MKTETLPETCAHLPKGHCVHLIASNAQAMICGVAKLTQNNKGEIAMHYPDGRKKSVPMADLNLAKATDFFATYRAVWARAQGLG